MSADLRVTAIAAALICALAPAALAQAPSAACQKDLEANDVRFKQTIEKLESVKNGTQRKNARPIARTSIS